LCEVANLNKTKKDKKMLTKTKKSKLLFFSALVIWVAAITIDIVIGVTTGSWWGLVFTVIIFVGGFISVCVTKTSHNDED
jgi:hypothetical protein